MRFFYKISIALIVAVLSSCTTDNRDEIVIPTEGSSKFELSLEGLRTHIGEKGDDGNSYPLFWSEDDQISVNGEASNPLTAEAAGGARAVFTFGDRVLTAPYCVAYPAAAKGQVLFAENQEHTSNTTFDQGVAVMYGYGVKSEGIQLKHLTGVLKIGVVGSATLKNVKISTIDRTPIAGAFNIDFETGQLTPSADAAEVINYSFGDGVKLNEATPTYIHVAVPEGVYDELYVTLFDTSGGVMYGTVKAHEQKPLAAGKIREFIRDGKENYLVYNPDTDLFVISDFASLIEFRNQVNLGTLTKDAILVDDVVIPADDATLGSISGDKYTGTLNGNGYAIKGLEHPLFHTMSGTIKGLHLEDVRATDRNNFARTFGMLVNTYTGPSISHCSMSGEITLSRNLSSTNYIGGMVGQVVATGNCEISNCVNNCEMSFSLNDSSKRQTSCIGGLVAKTSSEVAGVTITLKNNTNNSTINIEGSPERAEVYVGGVVSLIGVCPNTVLEGCSNTGEITADFYIAQAIHMGGLVGRYYRTSSETGNRLSLKDCSNSGDLCYAISGENKVYSSSTTYYSMIGGCFGQLEDCALGAITVENCDNSGTINIDANPSDSRILSLYDVGGVAGFISGYVEVRDCENRADELILAMNKPNKNSTIGGLFGRVVAYTDASKAMSLTNCANHAKVLSNVTNDTLAESYVGGAIGQIYAYKDIAYNIKLDNVDNYGSVISMSQGRVANSVTASSYVAGLVGAIGGGNTCGGANNKAASSQFTIQNCDNVGDAAGRNRVRATGKSFYRLYAGGLVGYADAPFTMDSCNNSMPYLYDAEVLELEGYYGGVVASLTHCTAGLTTTINGCTNSGAIKIEAKKSVEDIIVSGIVGYLNSANAMTLTAKSVTNSGAITAGGVDKSFDVDVLYIAGILAKMDLEDKATYNLSGVTNTGDIEVVDALVKGETESDMGEVSGGFTRSGVLLSPDSESYIGGAVGNLTRSLSGVKSICNIKAYMFERSGASATRGYKNVGALTGDARANDVKLTDCYVGGTICRSAERDAKGSISENVVQLSTDNYYDYIYGKSIDAATASSDRCTFVVK